MFGLFQRDPKKKLEEEYARIMVKAVESQRNGKLELFAELTAQSEAILEKIEALEKKSGVSKD